MTRIEVPVSEARPGDIAVLFHESWPREEEAMIRAADRDGALLAGIAVVRGFGSVETYIQRVYREVPDLPTEMGSVIRATIRGVPNTVAIAVVGNEWYTPTKCEGHLWHSPEHIDLASVVVGRIVFDDDEEKAEAAPVSEIPKTFLPGTVVRNGRDPYLHVRNYNGTWSEAYLGHDTVKPRASTTSVSDQEIHLWIKETGAQVVYPSVQRGDRKGLS